MKQKFLICQHCGNIVAMIRDKGVPVYCCGEEMQELIPGTSEASGEKHIPVYKVEGTKVDSTKAVAAPNKAINHIQKTAPGPPTKIAEATPAKLPVPTLLDNDTAKAPNEPMLRLPVG